LKILSFVSSLAFRNWLENNSGQTEGIWLWFFKKSSGKKSINHAEALDQALCYGWIDGQAKPNDERSWLQKFTPRRAKSGWSKLNKERVERLTAADQMTRAGFEAIAAAKADGRWQAAYDSSSNAAPPEDFLKALDKHKKAKEFFETLNRANVYSIVYRLQTAKKPETRAKRMNLILEMLKRGETFHPVKKQTKDNNKRNNNNPPSKL
jgi:uncharacterized protein YdeI (YjbR/CyaY-like superfamily)